MQYSPDYIYHVYNQGNNRQKLFHEREDYLIFLTLYKRLVAPECSTINWCVMPNHFHFMIHTDLRCLNKIRQGNILLDPISNGIRKLLSSYTRIYNNRYNLTGSLFRQKTKAKCISAIRIKPGSPDLIQDYYVNCFHYIHQNPLVAGLVKKMEDWEFSSFRDYAGLRNGNLCNKELAQLHCGYNVSDFIASSYSRVEEKFIKEFI